MDCDCSGTVSYLILNLEVSLIKYLIFKEFKIPHNLNESNNGCPFYQKDF